MKSLPFGLDIGASSVKVVWLSQDQGMFFLNAASSMPLFAKGMQSDSPFDQEQMAKALQGAVKNAKITTPFVNVALPENQVYTRILEMPVLSDKELSSAIYWEAEQYIPVPLNTVTFDWKVLAKPKSTEAGATMKVLLVGAPTTIIDRYQKIIGLSGLTINAVETEILSVARSVITDNNFPNTLLIHIGAISTLIAIIKDATIIFTYFVPVGGTAISRAIAADFSFTIAQAEEYKRLYGYSSKTFGGKIGKSSEPILMSILTEVKKAIALYTDKFKGETPIQQILLSGGTAKLAGIDLFFTEHSGIQTAIVNPWKILKDAGQLPKEITGSGPDYVVAIGLAMRDYA
ncbi:MAG: type IV pilus assembly protein PilM [Candidatus Levybacteria bacterium]|nr:type IV pilus assembly protein PilM [Candidatus Levybacteria bacterium]